MKTYPHLQYRSKVGWHLMLKTLDSIFELVDTVGQELTVQRPTQRLIYRYTKMSANISVDSPQRIHYLSISQSFHSPCSFENMAQRLHEL